MNEIAPPAAPRPGWSRKHSWAVLASLGALALAAAIFPWRILQGADEFSRWLDGIRASPWAEPIFITIYTVCCLVAPVTPFTVSGVVLFGLWKGTLLGLLASNLGAWAAFWIARVLGRDAVKHLLRGKADAIDRGLERNGFAGVLMMRLIGMPPFIIINYLAGLSGVRFKDYALASVIGIAPWAIAISLLADVFWRKFLEFGVAGVREALGENLGFILAFIGGAAVLGAAVWAWRRRKRGP